jgi:hypothetical protein
VDLFSWLGTLFEVLFVVLLRFVVMLMLHVMKRAISTFFPKNSRLKFKPIKLENMIHFVVM